MGWALVVFASAVLVSPVVAEDGKPLPLRGPAKVGGQTFHIEGRRVLEGRLSIQQGTRVVGKGLGAVLVVKGHLTVTGTAQRRCSFENVVIELPAEFREVHISTTKFLGGAGIKSALDEAVSGRLFLEECTFERESPLNFRFQRGTIDLITILAQGAVNIQCVNPPKKDTNSVRVNVMSCGPSRDLSGALHGGLFIDGANDCTVRLNYLGGDRVVLSNNRKLMFDGNKVKATTLEIRQDVAGRLSKTKILKCDVYSRTIKVFAPKDGKKKDIVRVDKCWFKIRHKNRKDLLAKVFDDGAKDEKNGARVIIQKVMEKPLALAGEGE